MNEAGKGSLLTEMDCRLINQRIEQQARASTTDAQSYNRLINDEAYQQAVIANYLSAKRLLMQESGRGNEMGPMANQLGYAFLHRTKEGTINMPERASTTRDRIAQEYGVVMSQFQTNFKDTAREALRTSNRQGRQDMYAPKIGCLGMKAFDFELIPPAVMLKALFNHTIEGIETRQLAVRRQLDIHFLDSIGMDHDISSYYQAHRKTNLGGASSYLHAFNETESFSFCQQCMKRGLETDVAAMDEAVAKKSKNHPCQRISHDNPRGTSKCWLQEIFDFNLNHETTPQE